jgi:choline kinase
MNMDKMTIIITMAGLGSRFRKAGYNVPKYMINAKNKTLFEWSMESLLDYNAHVEKYIFVVRKEDNASEFIRSKCTQYDIKDLEILEIDYLTDGQATTCMLAIPYCKLENPIMVYNIDTYIEAFELKFSNIAGHGNIPCFKADGDHWSFVKLDENGKAVEVKEKVRISDNCTLGAYYFASAKLFKDLYSEYYEVDDENTKTEKYIAPLYNEMIKKGLEVTISIVDSSKVHVLGTPEELKEFLNE